MKIKLAYLKLQIKSAFASIPRIILGSLIITLLAVGLCFGIYRATENSSEESKMAVALVYSEDSREADYINMAFSYIGEEDTVGSVCTFERVDKETAYKGLRDGNYTVALVIPDEFITDVMYGVNTPIEVVYNGEGVNNTSAVFREMLRSGAEDLGTAEAGVYSVENLFYTVLKAYRSQKSEHVDAVNMKYFDYALDRDVYFKTVDISGKGGLSTAQFYGVTIILMLLLLSGVTCSANLRGESAAFSTVLRSKDVHAFETGTCKVTGLTVCYFCLLEFVSLLAMILSIRFTAIKAVLGIDNVFEGLIFSMDLLIVIVSVFAMIYCIFNWIDNPVYSVLVLFLIGMASMYASGCFVTGALLPNAIRKVGYVLPTYWNARLIGEMLRGTCSFTTIILNIIYGTAFTALGALAEKYRRIRGDR